MSCKELALYSAEARVEECIFQQQLAEKDKEKNEDANSNEEKVIKKEENMESMKTYLISPIKRKTPSFKA